MQRFKRMACLALAAGLLGGVLWPASASAQVVYYPAPTVTYYAPAPTATYYAPAPPVTYSYYPAGPVVQQAYYAAPTTVFYAPTTVYSAPTYAAPVYAAPTTAYYQPPTVTSTGVATTRSYFGLGIFRPFGYNQVNTYTPTGVYYNPGRVSYYYAP